MSNLGFMTKEDNLYFTDCFNEYQKNGQITLDQFREICHNYKNFDKVVLDETIKDLKATLDKKNNIPVIYFKHDDYFNHVNTVFKDQAQMRNQNDPEMELLFKSLAGKDGDYVYKKKLSDIITVFYLPIDLNEFFKPVGGQEELNFNEFCCLFRAEKMDEKTRNTFYHLIDRSSKEPKEKEEIKDIYKANFPIKYYGN